MFRTLRKVGVVAAAALLMAGWTGSASAADDEAANKSRILIVYYSHTGITKGIAERLQKNLGAEIFRVEPEEAYPEDGQAIRAQARKEVDEGMKPELKGDLPELDDIDLVLVGGPVWFGTLAPPLSSFLAQADLKGKTVAPFCTFGGGQGEYFKRFKDALPEEATALDGLGLGREQLKDEEGVKKAIDEWTAKLPKTAAE